MGKTLRVNKTENNLQTVWNQLDNASGELYNALFTIASMTDLSAEIRQDADRIDVTEIDSLKNLIEEIMIKKRG